jgi:hypothetical protein
MLLPRFTRSFAKWLVGLSAGAVAAGCLVACGGGGTTTAGNGSGVGSGGTGSFTTGSVTGFGSVIVNGIRYDNSGITPSSLDNDTVAELKLGMVIDVEGGETSQVTKATGEVQTVAKASSVKVGFELLGPVTSGSVSASNGTFRSLGQAINVTVDTFFDQNSGLAGLSDAQKCPYVRVYGFPNNGSGYTATRIECLSVLPSFFRVRGQVNDITGNLITINQGQYTLPANVSPPSKGQVVRALLSTSGTSWTVVSFNGESRPLSQTRAARVEGVVSDYSAATGSLHVNGVPVTVSNITTLQLIDATLAAGMRVEVRGQLVNGVLNAALIKQDDERYDPPSSGGGSGGGGGQPPGDGLREIELHGTVQSLDTNAKSIVTRGVTVYYVTGGSKPTRFSNGTASNLAGTTNGVGPFVEIKGVRSSSSAGAIVATEIKFSND